MVRWNKVFRELWLNLGRSLLVVASIAIGVTAIGIVIGTQQTLSSEIPAIFERIYPASASLTISSFDDELVDIIRKMPGVVAAEGRNTLVVQLKTSPTTWQSLTLVVIPDFNNISINKIFQQSGDWPPAQQQMLIERASIDLTGAQMGELVTIETSDGRQRQIKIAGLVHDMSEPSAVFSNQIKGYITLDTLEWLGYSRNYNQLLLATKIPDQDISQLQAVVFQVRDRVEKSGRTVYWTNISDPSQHWFLIYLEPMAAILGALGILSLILSSSIVVNTISALLAQQTRQVGIMKAVGGRQAQIIGLYLGMVLIFGVLALVVAVPLSDLGARKSIALLASLINFDTPDYEYPRNLLIFQAAISVCVPCIVSLFPILSGTRVSVQKALAFTGMRDIRFGAGLFDRAISVFKGFPRPLLLSLRNTFRKKTRLVLTVFALTLGSAIFIAVAGVQNSLTKTLDEALRYYNFDIMVSFAQPYRVEQIRSVTREVPNVSASETWGLVDSHRVRPDGSESESILFVAPPPGTQMVKPTLIQGRWLDPADENAVVVNTDVIRENTDLQVGSELILKIDGKKVPWVIVGVVKSVMIGPWAYANYGYFANRLNKAGIAGAVYIQTESHTEADLAATTQLLANQYKNNALHVSSISSVAELRTLAVSQFNVILTFLLIFSALIAVIGGLSVTGTMSLNVIERSREIGIMRAVGARNLTVLQIVLVEGGVIGILSWLAGCLLAYPIGNYLSGIIGSNFLQTPMAFAYSQDGALLWLGIVLLLATFASLVPAINATRVSIREVLSYE